MTKSKLTKNGVSCLQCFTLEQVKKINKKIEEIEKQKEEEKDFYVAHDASKIGEFFHVQCSPLMPLIHQWLYQCQYVNREIFGYDIYWNFHLEIVNYNIYGVGGEYGWHIDSNYENTPIDMKLTCLLNLSEEPYEGGEFSVINSKEKIKFDSGMGVVFNSLMAHKVAPVTKGVRKTLTYWGFGPSWR